MQILPPRVQCLPEGAEDVPLFAGQQAQKRARWRHMFIVCPEAKKEA